MKIGTVCNRLVSTITRESAILDAARRMRDEHVGDLVVVERVDGRTIPVGMLTDRDLVVGVLARSGDRLEKLDVGDVVTREVLAVRDSDDVDEVVDVMRRAGVRRVPVVDAEGDLVGIFTLDDLLQRVAAEMASLATVVARERRQEAWLRP